MDAPVAEGVDVPSFGLPSPRDGIAGRAPRMTERPCDARTVEATGHILTVGLEDYFQARLFRDLIDRDQWYRLLLSCLTPCSVYIYLRIKDRDLKEKKTVAPNSGQGSRTPAANVSLWWRWRLFRGHPRLLQW